MDENQIEKRQKEIVKVTLIGTIINAILIILKFTAGIIGNSAAMVADGVHSLSDFLTDFVVIVMLNISSKPSDEDHDFGHGKYETLATTIIGLLLILVGGGILFSGSTKIYNFVINGEELTSPGWMAFGAAIVSILLKEGIFQYTIAKTGYSQLESSVRQQVANSFYNLTAELKNIENIINVKKINKNLTCPSSINLTNTTKKRDDFFISDCTYVKFKHRLLHNRSLRNISKKGLQFSVANSAFTPSSSRRNFIALRQNRPLTHAQNAAPASSRAPGFHHPPLSGNFSGSSSG